MNRDLWKLAILQGLFLTNNVTYIAINGLVGLSLAPHAWMATLPVMAYVVGGALCTAPVAWTQARFGRKTSFQLGLAVALACALLCAFAARAQNFWLLCLATLAAGYYQANGQLYRFTAAELAAPAAREKAVSLVMAGGLLGAVLGPNLASRTREMAALPFVGAYLALAVVAALAMLLLATIRFPAAPTRQAGAHAGRPLSQVVRQPVFLVAAGASALSYGVMNLLMAATPLAMQQCGLPFSDAAFVLEWHVIGMFAPGFFTGHLIRRFGVLNVMGAGVVLCLACASDRGLRLREARWRRPAEVLHLPLEPGGDRAESAGRLGGNATSWAIDSGPYIRLPLSTAYSHGFHPFRRTYGQNLESSRRSSRARVRERLLGCR